MHLCINAGGSSTYNNAVKAAELLEDERPGHKMKIHLIDSHTYSMPYGWYLCECARKVRAGEPLDACLAAPPIPNGRLAGLMKHKDFVDYGNHFENLHPGSDWKSCMEQAERIGLGSRDYELKLPSSKMS